MNAKTSLQLYKSIFKIREVEKKIAEFYSQEEMRCPVHLSTGQEAIPVGICENLKSYDQILSAHRSHAHYLAKGGNLKAMISEIYGKETGCAKGKGGSMHLIDIKAGMMAAVPIVGSTIPISVGFAWANKLKKNNKVVVVFFGDAATEEGVFHESLDFASLHNLPILFVCENNFYSVYSNIYKRQSRFRVLSKIVESRGIKFAQLDGNNLEKIFKYSKSIINSIRKGKGPFFIELKTYRLIEHCGPNNDDNLNYRPKSEIKYWSKKCPVNLFKKKLSKSIDSKIINATEKKILDEINKAFLFAKKSKFPDKKLLKKHIYA